MRIDPCTGPGAVVKEERPMVGVLSVLEGEPYRLVKGLWKTLERQHHWAGVQTFSHPHISFQGALQGDLGNVGLALGRLLPEILPIEIEVDGFGQFGRNVIFLRVRKTDELVRANKLINEVLAESCQDLIELYTPHRWTPHITIAMEDGLSHNDFGKVWNELSKQTIQFTQQLHNLCTIKSVQNGKFRIARKYECK